MPIKGKLSVVHVHPCSHDDLTLILNGPIHVEWYINYIAVKCFNNLSFSLYSRFRAPVLSLIDKAKHICTPMYICIIMNGTFIDNLQLH